ncbi:MAG: hypothetical protein RIQ93_2670 [Verrucomicrobiota bacterium]|jgi:uncharacterized membrane protein (DUF4010 family)
MSPLLTAIVASAALGALVGLIRQWSDESAASPGTDFAGVRTYTFWAMLGCLGAYAAERSSALLLAVIFILAGVQQILAKTHVPPAERAGGTTFASTLLTMLIGSLIYWEQRSAAILVAATTMVLLGSKQRLHAWTRTFTAADARALLQFAAITGVILPLVPDRDVGPFAGFNPYSTWLMVVLISGLGFAGYIAMRLFGASAGILLTSFLGGLASSTASTLAFTRRSREEPAMSGHYALAVIVACTVMLPRVVIATTVINPDFGRTLIVPFAILILPGVLYASWVWLRDRPSYHEGDLPLLTNPLSLTTAIKFAALYSMIAFLVKAVGQLESNAGLLPLSFVSGLTDMDAISLSVARDAGGESLDYHLATRAVVLAAISNTLLKAGFAVGLGSAGLRGRVALVLGATAVAGIGWLLLAS